MVTSDFVILQVIGWDWPLRWCLAKLKTDSSIFRGYSNLVRPFEKKVEQRSLNSAFAQSMIYLLNAIQHHSELMGNWNGGKWYIAIYNPDGTLGRVCYRFYQHLLSCGLRALTNIEYWYIESIDSARNWYSKVVSVTTTLSRIKLPTIHVGYRAGWNQVNFKRLH